MSTLTEILNKYNTDKNETFHNYGRFYERYIKEFRDKPINYLEIGVWYGQSIKAMREYFHNCNAIVGIDIMPQTKIFENKDNKIFIEIGSQNDVNFLNNVNTKHGGFDVILDDGSHTFEDIWTSFITLFPLLNNKGMYIIEDVICIRDKLEPFYNFTKFLSKWRADVDETKNLPGSNCVDPFKIPLKTTNEFEYMIGDIVFTNSAIIIYKDVKDHWKM